LLLEFTTTGISRVASEDKHPSTTHHRPEVDAQRRRFAKGGLAAPVVIGSLLSRPVLGATHNCTVSGQISGNVSTHEQGICSTLGRSPDNYLTNPPHPPWPNATQQIASCYYRLDVLESRISAARVADVLRGDWDPEKSNHQLLVKSGYDQQYGIALGREAVAAYLNATGTGGYPTFPVSGAQVLEMFNAVITPLGTYDAGGAQWDIVDVTTYFRSLHP
jgi:hypothetical protein